MYDQIRVLNSHDSEGGIVTSEPLFATCCVAPRSQEHCLRRPSTEPCLLSDIQWLGVSIWGSTRGECFNQQWEFGVNGYDKKECTYIIPLYAWSVPPRYIVQKVTVQSGQLSTSAWLSASSFVPSIRCSCVGKLFICLLFILLVTVSFKVLSVYPQPNPIINIDGETPHACITDVFVTLKLEHNGLV